MDPRLLLYNYDNNLSQHDIISVPQIDHDTRNILRSKIYGIVHLLINNGFMSVIIDVMFEK